MLRSLSHETFPFELPGYADLQPESRPRVELRYMSVAEEERYYGALDAALKLTDRDERLAAMTAAIGPFVAATVNMGHVTEASELPSALTNAEFLALLYGFPERQRLTEADRGKSRSPSSGAAGSSAAPADGSVDGVRPGTVLESSPAPSADHAAPMPTQAACGAVEAHVAS